MSRFDKLLEARPGDSRARAMRLTAESLRRNRRQRPDLKAVLSREEVMETNLSSIASYKTSYGYHRVLDIPWDTAVQRAKEALRAEEFGVLCEIDISQKLKEKLGIDFYRYLILGVCNPSLALQALEEVPDLRLLLLCNVVVYEREGCVVVSTIDADKMLSIADNPLSQAGCRKEM
jgi:uncharacterized protein (DUF302 family)